MYPFAVYYGLNNFSPAYLATILFTIVMVRFFLFSHQRKKMPWLLPATIFGALALLLSVFFETTLGFKLYPVAINTAMLVIFSYSYIKPPTVIESLARLTEKNFPDAAIPYTNKVTLIWCLFFFINGSIALYTAIYTTMEIWMIYNGLISYILIGLLMGIEFLVRLKHKKKHQQSTRESQ